jgi:hypothetical protein
LGLVKFEDHCLELLTGQPPVKPLGGTVRCRRAIELTERIFWPTTARSKTRKPWPRTKVRAPPSSTTGTSDKITLDEVERIAILDGAQ